MVVAVAIVVILAAVVLYPRGTPPSETPPVVSTACNGTQIYRGTVSDANDTGLGGVQVTLAATPPHSGINATVTTSSSGSWAAVVSGTCSYDANLYWQSAPVGPRLRTIDSINRTSAVSVDVSRVPITLQWFKEFPNSPGTNASIYMPPRNLTFSVEAVSHGNISLRFLDLDAALRPATNFTYPYVFRASGTSPFAVADVSATAYKVVDTEGNWVIFAMPGASNALSVVNASETMTMAQAISSSGPGGYETVGAHSWVEWTFSASVDGGPLGVATRAFGVPLQGFYSMYAQNWPGTFAEANVTLTNSSGGSACFVVFGEFLNAHAWYYGPGRCP